MNEGKLFQQMELVRARTMKAIDAIDSKIVDIMPPNFNNTIRWHIGHILFTQESLLFRRSGEPLGLPEAYEQWFGNGTKPADWVGMPPSITELVDQLQHQTGRIKECFSGRLEQQVPKAFLAMETIGEILLFSNYHEGAHMGNVNAMKRLIEANSLVFDTQE